MMNTKRPNFGEKRDVKEKLKHEQFKTIKTVDENKVTTEKNNGPANFSKKFLWKPRQQDYHFQKVQQSAAKTVEKPNVLTSRNNQQKYAAMDCKTLNKPLCESTNNRSAATYARPATSYEPGSSKASKIINSKSSPYYHATSNKLLVGEVVAPAKTLHQRSNRPLSKDALKGADKLQTPLSSDAGPKTSRKYSKSSLPQRAKRQRRLNDKKNTPPKLNIQHTQKQFLSNYNALFMKKHLKVGHNSRKRILHRPEISYIFEDKMCWFKPRQFQQPRRLLKYRNTGILQEDVNASSTESFLLPSMVNLECHIFGFPKCQQKFKDFFKKLCEIIGVEDMNIVGVRIENGAKVVQLKDSSQRNKLLAAYKYYMRLVEAGTVLPITSKLCGGTKKNKIYILPGPKNMEKQKEKSVKNGIQIPLSTENWASVLYRQRQILVSGIERRGYGAIINASKILCHAF